MDTILNGNLAEQERMIEVRELRHAYAGRLAVAVDSWTAAAGEHWLVHGPSGCGKTTLLHLVAGLLRPDAGAVRVAGQTLSALSGGALARALVNEPDIVLADEPTSSLDDDNAGRAAALLREQAQANDAVLVVASHDRRLADSFANRLDLSRQAA